MAALAWAVVLLAVAFFVVPAVELFLIITSSRQIGFLNTVGVLILISIVGAWLVKREGRRVWTRFTSQISAGSIPSDEIADGVCVLGAGALLMTPGFLTDLVAVLLLIPLTRAPLRRWLVRRYSGRASVIGGAPGPFSGAPPGAPGSTWPGSTWPGSAGPRRGGSVYDTTGRDAAAPHPDHPQQPGPSPSPSPSSPMSPGEFDR